MLTHFSLFTGIGGIDLAGEWAGFETVGQCEIDDYCTKVLEKHWPDVPRWRDVRELSARHIREAGIEHVTLLSFGSPCQDLSVAGKGAGLDGERSGLFFEAIRLARELRPDWLLFENVRGLISRGVDRAIRCMEAEGYEVRPFVLAAADVGAWHKRERCFFVAYAHQERRDLGSPTDRQNAVPTNKERQPEEDKRQRGGWFSWTDSVCKITTHTDSKRQLQSQRLEQDFGRRVSNRPGWESEPDVVRVVYGVPDGMDRIGALGNAVVPAQVYPVLKAIAEIERRAA